MGQLDYVTRPKTGAPYAPDREPACAMPVTAAAATMMTPLAKATAPHDGPSRLAWSTRTLTVDLLEGEERHVDLPLPWNTHTEDATLSASSSSPMVRLGAVPRRLPSTKTSDAVAVTTGGVPARVSGEPGTHQVTIRVRAGWADGDEAEQVTVIVKVRRRDRMTPEVEATLTTPAMAAAAAAAAEKRDKESAERAGTDEDVADTQEFSDERDRMEIALGTLNKSQQTGVEEVQDNAGEYKRKPAPTQITWGDLVSLAVSLASAGVAGLVASKLAGALAGLASGPVEQAVRIGVGVVPEPKGEGLAGAVEEVTMAFAGAIEHGVRGAVASAPTSGDASTSLSAFFSAQRQILSQSQQTFALKVVDGARPLRRAFAADPSGTLKRMQASRNAMMGQQDAALDIQRAQTTTALARYFARAKLGSEVVSGTSTTAKVEATPLEKLTKRAAGGADPKGEDGVLDLFVPTSSMGKPLTKVKSARLTGMAKRSAGFLAGKPIASLTIPARIVIGRHEEKQARITIDEAGRTNFDGDLETLTRATSDLAETATVDERVAAVVARVRAQAVPTIETDDVG